MASGQARVALRSLSATPLGYGVLQYCKLTTLERKVADEPPADERLFTVLVHAHNTVGTIHVPKGNKTLQGVPSTQRSFLNRSSCPTFLFFKGKNQVGCGNIGGNGWGLVCTFLSAPIRGVKVKWDGS